MNEYDNHIYLTGDDPMVQEWNSLNVKIDAMIDEGQDVPEDMMNRVFDLLAQLEREGLI